MDTADFDYPLPADLIAQCGIEPRDAARLYDASGPTPVHRHIRDLPSLVRPGDVVVVNDTRVLPARVEFRRSTGGSAEVLLLEPSGGAGWWEALVRPSAKLRPGVIESVAPDLSFEFGDDLGEGRRLVRPVTSEDLLSVLERHGAMPIPPYLAGAELADAERYQTVYAARPASAAAPTAGLHLTHEVLAGIEAAGARIVRVELVVGLGTFRPMTTDRVEDHTMHAERFQITQDAWSTIQAAQRVIAVGTTCVRALESAAALDTLAGSTSLFIRHPFDWKVVDVLLTNFHLPRSSLLVLVDAFAGPNWKQWYEDAIAHRYRMLSFGDAMLLARRELTS